MFRGVFDRFPKLRVAFMEAGCSWAPYWFGRMNEEWENRGEIEAPMCKKKPSDYFKEGRIYFHAEDYEPLIGATAEILSHHKSFITLRIIPTGTRSFRKTSNISPGAKI